MSSFLPDLERELRAAHPRRRAARRRAAAGRALRSAPLVLAIVVTLATAAAFVIAVGREGTRESAAPGRDAVQPPSATTPDDPTGTLPRGSVAVLDGTRRPRIAALVADYLRAQTPVTLTDKTGGRPPTGPTTVFYAPGFERKARGLAASLAAGTRALDARTRNAARAADLVVVLGADVRGAREFALMQRRPFERVGTVRVLDREDGPDVISLEASGLGPGRLGLWLTDPDDGEERFDFLGFTPPPVDGRLDFLLEASEPLDYALTVSREDGRPGRTPGPEVAFAHMLCSDEDCAYYGP
jgi:hypothetical protein